MDTFYRKSKLSGRPYDLFSCVRIINVNQCAYYMDMGADLKDVYVSKNKDDKPILVFLFDKKETRELYDSWCLNHNLKKADK